jgi:hypothetical protein
MTAEQAKAFGIIDSVRDKREDIDAATAARG